MSTEKALLKFEGEKCHRSTFAYFCEKLLRIAADDAKALLHEVSPVDLRLSQPEAGY